MKLKINMVVLPIIAIFFLLIGVNGILTPGNQYWLYNMVAAAILNSYTHELREKANKDRKYFGIIPFICDVIILLIIIAGSYSLATSGYNFTGTTKYWAAIALIDIITVPFFWHEIKEVNKKAIIEKNIDIFLCIFTAFAIIIGAVVIKISYNWESLGYNYSEATMIAFIAGMINYGLAFMFFYEAIKLLKKNGVLTIKDKAMAIIPIGIGIFSYLIAYWKFSNKFFLFGMAVFIVFIGVFIVLSIKGGNYKIRKSIS